MIKIRRKLESPTLRFNLMLRLLLVGAALEVCRQLAGAR